MTATLVVFIGLAMIGAGAYLLVVTDHASRHAQAWRIRNTDPATASVAQHEALRRALAQAVGDTWEARR